MPKTFEELMAGLEPDAAALVGKHLENLQQTDKSTIATLQGKVTELEKSKTVTTEQVVNSDVLKNADPAVQALVTKMQGQMQQLLDAQASDMVEKRFQLCKAIPVEEAAMREVLKSASPAVMAVLEKAATAITASLHTAKGVDVNGNISAGTSDEAYAALEKSAKAISVAESISFEKAFGEACTRDQETYKKYVEGVR